MMTVTLFSLKWLWSTSLFLLIFYLPFFKIWISLCLSFLSSMAQCMYVCCPFSLLLSISFSLSHKVYMFFILNYYKNSTSLWCHWPMNLMPLCCHCVKRTHGLKGSMCVCDNVFLSLGVSLSFLVSSFRISVILSLKVLVSISFRFMKFLCISIRTWFHSKVFEFSMCIYKNSISLPSI